MPSPRAATTVAVLGLGYVGLPTAVVLARAGLDVVGVDIDPRTVASVNAGVVPFVEPDLDDALREVVGRGRLRAGGDVPPADVFVIAVPTPVAADRTADLSYVEAAADAVARVLRGGELVVLESTSPPGTTRRLAGRLLAARPDLAMAGTGDGRPEISVAHAPERVLPGRVLAELVTNDRVVGGITPRCARRTAELYRLTSSGEIVETDAVTAELAKLAENSFRDVNIAFANELAAVSDELGVDVWELIEITNRHPRVDILRPGPGVGGHCIAVDPWFVVAAAPGRTRLIRTAREVNDARPAEVADRVVAALDGVAARAGGPRTVACLGLAYKRDIDDLRESPAVEATAILAERLAGHARVLAVEPHVEGLPGRLAALGVEPAGLDEAVAAADAVVLLVDHSAFAGVSAADLAGKAVVDTRGLWRRRVPGRPAVPVP